MSTAVSLVTVAATDSDNDSLTYSLTTTSAGSIAPTDYTIDSSTGQIKYVGSGEIRNCTGSGETRTCDPVTIYAKVTDSKNAEGQSDSGIDATAVVTVSLTANGSPVLSTAPGDTTGSITAGTVGSTTPIAVVSLAVQTPDPEGNSLTYSLGPPASAPDSTDHTKFSIGTQTGAITYTGPGETKTPGANVSLVLNARVADGKDSDGAASTEADDNVDVTVSVSDNSPPTFSHSSYSWPDDSTDFTYEPVSNHVGTAVATDSDGDALAYSLSNASVTGFTVRRPRQAKSCTRASISQGPRLSRSACPMVSARAVAPTPRSTPLPQRR